MQIALRRTLLAALFLISCHAVSCHTAAPEPEPSAPAKKLLTLEQTMGQGEKVDFTGELARYSWASDGVHLEFTEKDKDGKDKKVWLEPAKWTESEPQKEEKKEEAAEAKDDEALAKALLAAGADEKKARKVPARSIQRAANGAALVTLGGDVYWVQGESGRKLVDAAEGELELRESSPDGQRVALVQANDLVLLDAATGTRRDVTSDGSADVFNGKLDWVYQEEVYGRGDFKSFWWSPDSRHLAFLRLDETKVFDFTVVDNIEEGNFRVKPEVTRYPKVGDPNPIVALGLVDAAENASESEGVRWVDLSKYEKEEPLVVRVDWTPKGESLFYALQDRVQTWLELCAADPTSAASRSILRESSMGWVNRADAPRWLADGTFLWLSERTGQRHIYRYKADGTLVSALTSGDWSVRDIDELDEARGLLWFTATKDGAVNGNTYRLGLDGTNLVRLTHGEGQHSLRWNKARTHFLDRHSSLAEPPHLELCDADGNVVRDLGRASAPDLESYATSRTELVAIPARDGFALDASVMLPVPFDPAKRYPIWLPTYSGPDSPSVSNAWSGSSWNQFLAENGVIVLTVNVRTASGKGQSVIEGCYKQLGVQELADLEDAVAWVCANRSGDPARVGITGGSYGGFMSAFALTHSDRFALGIAASGVYDWRMYDTIYTERYMSTPDKNKDGYEKTSVVGAAANLKGHLVLTHGEMDDNVHLQNAVQLIYALEKADKDFEFVLYPQSRHGLARDLRTWDRRMTWRQIREHLLGVE